MSSSNRGHYIRRFAEGPEKRSSKNVERALEPLRRERRDTGGAVVKEGTTGILDEVRETLVAKVEAQYREVWVLLTNTADQKTPLEWWNQFSAGTRNEGRVS